MNKQNTKISLKADSPIEVSVSSPFKNDLLQFESPVSKVASLLSNITTPFTVGLYGNWGSGKTSYMKLLSSQLSGHNNFETFWFNAWEYENEYSLLLPLLAKLSAKIDPKSELFNSIKKVAAAVLMTGANFITRTATVGTTNLKDIQNYLELYENKVGESYEKWVSDIEQLKKQFKELVNNICQDKFALIIFIDDLDRCLPENVIKLIENIKHFLSIDGTNCIFVIGVDKNVISSAILSKYGSNIISGDEYLEKIINLSLLVPETKLDTHKEYIIKVIQQQTAKSWYSTIETKVILFAEALSEIGYSNPRRTKALITRYLIFLGINDSKKYIIEIIVLLLIYKEFFPDAYKMKHDKKNVGYFPETTKKNGNSPIESSITFDEMATRSCIDFALINNEKSLISLSQFEYNLNWFITRCFNQSRENIEKALNNTAYNQAPQEENKKIIVEMIDSGYCIKHESYFEVIDFLFTLS